MPLGMAVRKDSSVLARDANLFPQSPIQAYQAAYGPTLASLVCKSFPASESITDGHAFSAETVFLLPIDCLLARACTRALFCRGSVVTTAPRIDNGGRWARVQSGGVRLIYDSRPSSFGITLKNVRQVRLHRLSPDRYRLDWSIRQSKDQTRHSTPGH